MGREQRSERLTRSLAQPLVFWIYPSLSSTLEPTYIQRRRATCRYRRVFYKAPEFTFGNTIVVDATGKVHPVDMTMGGPSFFAETGESILPPSNDGSSRYLFTYRINSSSMPKVAGELRLLSSISTEGITVPIKTIIKP